MDQEVQRIILETLRSEGIDLVVTLPEEPTYPLTRAAQEDPYFRTITVAAEGNGLAFTAGASLGAHKAVFVTGVAGMLVGAWALFHMSTQYFGFPLLILASYRGDIGDRSGISGSALLPSAQVAEPLLQTLRIPYRVVRHKSELRRSLEDAIFSCWEYSSPVVVLLAGEVLW